MGLLADVRKFIYQEEVKFKAAISEATATKIGKTLNFILHRTHEKKDFFLNGAVDVFSGQVAIDGECIFEFDSEIFAVYMFNHIQGPSGTTELDIKKQTVSGGAWTSIFSTTPKISNGAGNYARIGIGQTVTGCVAPVLISGASPLNVDAGEALRIDCISAMPLSENAGIIIHFRPR